MGADRPLLRSDYVVADTDQVASACLSVAVALGSLLDEICIVGGLVPTLLIDHDGDPERHVGTTDLDIGLAITLFDEARYMEIAQQLRQEGFEPDDNGRGNRTIQRWRLHDAKVTIDFLISPTSPNDRPSEVEHLLDDLGAYIVPGIELAIAEREEVTLEGYTLRAEQVSRQIPVCGPGAFVVLKALALDGRGRPKDAYDLVYLLQRWSDGHDDIVARLAAHERNDARLVGRALGILARDFATLDSVGPARAAEFLQSGDRDGDLADARGVVDDLLRGCRAVGLEPGNR